QPEALLGELLEKIVALLPPAWLYPETTSARIVLGDRAFKSGGYRQAVQSLKADIVVQGETCGFVEVGYMWERPPLDEGPFLTEERHLIDTIAHELSVIVERKQVEDEKARLLDQLRHADRLATLGQLGAAVAHELNEPLANILGFAQLAAKDSGLVGQTRQDIERIVAATLHARDVITKLLAFARQTKGETTRIDLNCLIKDGLQFLQSRCAKSGIDLRRQLDEALPQITADRSQLLQVLTNLVVNAIQAMPNGGCLTVTTSAKDRWVSLIVEDTGTGMTEEVKERIFDPFFTTKGVEQGTGLGLSVVRDIVVSHGGTIETETRLGHGTKFIIRLPVAPS
ncbi:MAG TPA: ATP-binding protein, partial [Candidatus Deferrimicrobium sp.]|nr:ATP-binding protein [Candidatus Deferrimicrobium sp.]